MLRILYDDFDQKVKNIHDEMDLHHFYKKKRVWSSYAYIWKFSVPKLKNAGPYSGLFCAVKFLVY